MIFQDNCSLRFFAVTPDAELRDRLGLPSDEVIDALNAQVELCLGLFVGVQHQVTARWFVRWLEVA
jgi:hypothetical protein